MTTTSPLNMRVLTSLSAIDRATWNRCALHPDSGHNPFVSHEFLKALEDSGCATAETGWLGQHIVLENDAGIALGIMPLYLKSHSYGEYVFDHGWADAYHRAGGHYYPKLQASVPFSPVTGPRLLVHPDQDPSQMRKRLINAALALAEARQVSSLHVTFAEKPEWDLMARCGLLKRQDQQFHWINQGYNSFEDFLGSLSSRKRKNIRKERREALADGISVEILTGSDITESHWDSYFTFYMDTANRKWGRPYLNREFFSHLGAALADRVILILCRRNRRYIAGALNLLGDETLYGRYWGCIEDHRYLHFEVCYYQAIDYAIQTGLKKVEAGAQGEHKLARGYVPIETYSAHWIANPAFRQAVAAYLQRERAALREDMEYLWDFTPFKKTP